MLSKTNLGAKYLARVYAGALGSGHGRRSFVTVRRVLTKRKN